MARIIIIRDDEAISHVLKGTMLDMRFDTARAEFVAEEVKRALLHAIDLAGRMTTLDVVGRLRETRLEEARREAEKRVKMGKDWPRP